MEKGELIITTAKEIFLKLCTSPLLADQPDVALPKIDKIFKAITKTVIESCNIVEGK